MADDDDDDFDDQGDEQGEHPSDRDVGQPIRVLGRYLDQATDIAARCAATSQLLGLSTDYSRHEVVHAALQIGLRSFEGALAEADQGGGDAVLEVRELRVDPDLGTLFKCTRLPDGKTRLPSELRIPGRRVVVHVEYVTESPGTVSLLARRDPALERVVADLTSELPFFLLSPAPSSSWLALVGDLEANRQAPRSTRRSAARRRDFFNELRRNRDRSVGRLVASLLVDRANNGDRAHASSGKASFHVHQSVIQRLVVGFDDMPLTLAVPMIVNSQEWQDLCVELDRWRNASSREVHMGRTDGTDPVVVSLRRSAASKRFRYAYDGTSL